MLTLKINQNGGMTFVTQASPLFLGSSYRVRCCPNQLLEISNLLTEYGVVRQLDPKGFDLGGTSDPPSSIPSIILRTQHNLNLQSMRRGGDPRIKANASVTPLETRHYPDRATGGAFNWNIKCEREMPPGSPPRAMVLEEMLNAA